MEFLFVEKRTKAVETDAWGEWAPTTDTAPFVNTKLVQYAVNRPVVIRVQKRTRVLATDAWSAWDDTNDAPPYENTELVEFREFTPEVREEELKAASVSTASPTVISIADVTSNVQVDADNVVTGDGAFDDLMEPVNVHLKAQYDAGRINSTDYASVYLGAMQSVLTQAVKFALEKDNAGKKVTVTEQNIEVLKAQASLYARQEAGFDDNKYQKILDSQMNAWSITFQDTDTTFLPNQVQQNEFDKSFAAVRKNYKYN